MTTRNVSWEADVDFPALRLQKEALLKLIWDDDDSPCWGIVELLDFLQDQAVDSGQVPEEEVFIYSEE
jgi:hypothetical protein